MKIRIAGDIVTIISDISFEVLKKATKKNPLYITCEGKKVYGVKVGSIGNISEAGISFTYGTKDGYAALNICLPEAFNAEEATEYILDNLSDELNKFEMFEEGINNALVEAQASRDALQHSISID